MSPARRKWRPSSTPPSKRTAAPRARDPRDAEGRRRRHPQMSSVTSSITAAPANGLYAATKGGVNGLTKAAAIEGARTTSASNALAFAAIDIPGSMIWRYLEEQKVPEQTLVQAFPVKRMGRPEELVAAARYLCSDEARFCTGTTLVLDGASPPSNGPCSAEFARAATANRRCCRAASGRPRSDRRGRRAPRGQAGQEHPDSQRGRSRN